MISIPKKYCQFVFSGLQSGMTTAIAAAISSVPFYEQGTFVGHWARSYLLSWMVMLPIVLIATPLIRNAARLLTSSSPSTQ